MLFYPHVLELYVILILIFLDYMYYIISSL